MAISIIGIVILLTVQISLNVLAVLFDFYTIFFSNFNQYCGFIYATPIQPIENHTHDTRLIPPDLNHFDDWKKSVITIATFSAALSYVFMCCTLWGRYTRCEKCCCKACLSGTKWEPEHHQESSNKSDNVISPFIDDKYNAVSGIIGQSEADKRSSLFTGKQCLYFHLIFWSSFSIYVITMVLLIVILVRRISSLNPTLEAIDLSGLSTQLVSQFSALISCFIFSKLAYAVSNRCKDYAKCVFKTVDKEKNNADDTWKQLKTKWGLAEDQDATHLTILKKMDQRYNLLLKNSLSPFGTWFFIHWAMYMVTAFMSITYVINEITMEQYGKEEQEIICCLKNDTDCKLYLFYTFFFTVYHCILFIYPCFRAASVTRARKNMIKHVSNETWKKVSLAEKEAFITYLKDQNASFKISILCTRLTFGFELAFLSMIIGILGVVTKLSL